MSSSKTKIGLLPAQTDILLYNQAKDSKELEDCTALLWETILRDQFPLKDGFRTGSELRPEKGSSKKIDKGVFVIHNMNMTSLLYVEWKRAKQDTVSGRRDAEEQVTGYCQEYLGAHPNQEFM